MANIHFERKACSNELKETLFFATGVVPVKEKFSTHVTLKALDIEVNDLDFKNITVNSTKLKSLAQARYEIQRMIME